MSTIIKVENLSKAYQLGQFSTGTLSRDLERWWAIKTGKEDPFLKIGEENIRNKKGKTGLTNRKRKKKECRKKRKAVLCKG